MSTLPCEMIAAVGPDVGFKAASHLDVTFRRVLRGTGVTSVPGYVRLITGEAHPFGNFALLSDPADVHAASEAAGALVACGGPSLLFFTRQASREVAAKLLEAGYQSGGEMPAMAVEIDSLTPTSLPDGYALRRVSAGDVGRSWEESFAVGYELPAKVAGYFSPNAVLSTPNAQETLQFFGVFRGDRIVATSMLHLAAGVAGVYGVATIASERGRGLGAHVTAEPLRMARALGYRVSVLQSSAAGHGVYRRLGFRDVGGVPMYARMV